jgi:hypothetical protein
VAATKNVPNQRDQSSHPSVATQPIANAFGAAIAQNSFGPGFLLGRQKPLGDLSFEILGGLLMRVIGPIPLGAANLDHQSRNYLGELQRRSN